MTQNKHLRWIWLVVIGAFLGAVLGNVIGASIHSDNLPFFDVLGAIIGLGIGFTLFLRRATRSGANAAVCTRRDSV